eukprot:3470712-Pleurochrysis_carterae.AAC.2
MCVSTLTRTRLFGGVAEQSGERQDGEAGGDERGGGRQLHRPDGQGEGHAHQQRVEPRLAKHVARTFEEALWRFLQRRVKASVCVRVCVCTRACVWLRVFRTW